jgi:DNA-binding LytR/AlgR family response regulator
MIINCIIVDDEVKAIEILQKSVEKLDFLRLLASFRCASEALNYVRAHSVDLIFLDINMPDLNGLEMASLLEVGTHVILTTAYPEFAIKGFEINAVDYLLKPITFENFSKAIVKLNQYADIREKMIPAKTTTVNGSHGLDFVFFKSGKSLYKIDVQSIRYFEKDGNYFKLFTAERTLLIRMNFAKLVEMLPERIFVRIHKSYIISLKHIEKIDVDSVVIKNVTLPIGLNFRKDLNDAIQKFVQRM